MSDDDPLEPTLVENPTLTVTPTPSPTPAPPAPESSPNKQTQQLAAKRQQRCVERAEKYRTKFKGSEADVAEELLEQLVADEVEVLINLQELERTASLILHQALPDLPTAMNVARLLREVVVVHAAVRGRAERSLAAAASLRAQRHFLRRTNGS